MAETKSAAQKAVDKHDGWTLGTDREAVALTTSGQGGQAITVQPGHFTAFRRQPGTDTLVEVFADNPDQLAERIEAWEARQPAEPGTVTLSEEALLNSAKATVHMAVTAAARQSLDVDLTPATKKADAKAANVSSNPPVEVQKLDKDEAALVAANTAARGKVDGVGGVGPAAAGGGTTPA